MEYKGVQGQCGQGEGCGGSAGGHVSQASEEGFHWRGGGYWGVCGGHVFGGSDAGEEGFQGGGGYWGGLLLHCVASCTTV